MLESKKYNEITEETEARLKKARLVAKIIIYVRSVIVVLIIKFPKPYICILASLMFPLIGIFIYRRWNNLFTIELKRNSSKPNILPAFLLVIVYATRLQNDFFIDDYSNLWLPMIIITILFSALFLVGNEKILEGEMYRGILRIVIFSAIYGYAFIIGINCVFDLSNPEVFKSKVSHKEPIGIIYTKSYKVGVEPWNNKSEREILSVNEGVYENLQVGEDVSIYVFQGLFNIPWVEAGIMNRSLNVRNIRNLQVQ